MIWTTIEIIMFAIVAGVGIFESIRRQRIIIRLKKENISLSEGWTKERGMFLTLLNLDAKKCDYEWCDNIAEYRDDEDRDTCSECREREIHENGYRPEIYGDIKLLETGEDRRIPCPEWTNRVRLKKEAILINGKPKWQGFEPEIKTWETR